METNLPTPEVEEPSAAPNIKPDSMMVFKRTHVYAVLLPLAFVAGLAFGYVFWGQGAAAPSRAAAAAPSGTSTDPANSNQPAATQQQAPTRYQVSADNRPSIGPEGAPITIIEFSDYQCPFCKKFYLETYPKLMDAYKGKIRFVYRNFPLNGIHPDASPAAEAATCAGEQGVYWAYHDKLFSGDSLGNDAYIQYAKDLGLDVNKFQDCQTNHRYQSIIQEDYDFAANLGIRSTPTFFINGLAIVGAQPFEVFKQVIDQELAGQIP
jgi:protein-disulfide isomerase